MFLKTRVKCDVLFTSLELTVNKTFLYSKQNTQNVRQHSKTETENM